MHRGQGYRTAAAQKAAENALQPDPGGEANYMVQDNPFAYTPGQLMKLFNPKSREAFAAEIYSGFGGGEQTARRG